MKYMESITVDHKFLPQGFPFEVTLSWALDDQAVRGNAVVCEDKKQEKRIEDGIIKRIEEGDYWAWASVEVSINFMGVQFSEYLGCCSYKNAEDFITHSAYFDGMVLACAKQIKQFIEDLEEDKEPILAYINTLK